MKRNVQHIYDNISSNSSWNENYFRRKLYRKSKHILCSKPFFFSESRAVYEIMWKNTVDQGRQRMTICRMRVSRCVPKATNIHTKYVILIPFPLQQWWHERDSLLRYT